MENNWPTKYIKQFEDFTEKSYPALIKKTCLIIRNDINKNNEFPFTKTYNIDTHSIKININFSKSIISKKSYYSNVNIYDIIRSIEPTNISIIVSDVSIDIDHLMGIISHEIRHIYDVLTIVSDVEMDDFLKSKVVTKYKQNGVNLDFINLVYLSLEHELIARHNMLYEMFRWQGVTDKNELYKLFEKSYTFNALNQLKNFDYNFLIEQKDIIKFTEEFSKSIGDKFDGNIEEYYNRWKLFFKRKSEEFLGYIDSMLDEVIVDIKNDTIYERICGFISYNENIGNKISQKIFNNMISDKNIPN